MENEDKPQRRASVTEERKMREGGRRMPGGMLTPESSEALVSLVDDLYAPSFVKAIERSLKEARERWPRKP